MTEAFIQAIMDRTPKGEWIRVQYHPDGDWSVANAPEPPTISMDRFWVTVRGHKMLTSRQELERAGWDADAINRAESGTSSAPREPDE